MGIAGAEHLILLCNICFLILLACICSRRCVWERENRCSSWRFNSRIFFHPTSSLMLMKVWQFSYGQGNLSCNGSKNLACRHGDWQIGVWLKLGRQREFFGRFEVCRSL